MFNKTSWERRRNMMFSKWRAVMAAGIVLVCAMLAGCWLFPNVKPVAVFTVVPHTGAAPLTVSLDAQASSDSDGTIVSYEWTFSDGQSGVGQAVVHIYTTSGVYMASLTVTDNDGASAFSYETILVTSPATPPGAHTVSTPNTPTGPSSGQVGESLSFSTGGASCSLGHSVQYRFDWGNGNYSNWASSTSTSYSYPATGTYQVTAQARCTQATSVTSGLSSAKSVTISTVDTPATWTKIWGPVSKVILGMQTGTGTELIYAVESSSHDIYKYSGGTWTKVGGPGSMFVVAGAGELYGLTENQQEVKKYSDASGWITVGGVASWIYGAIDQPGQGLYAEPPASGDLMAYDGAGWKRISDYNDAGTSISAFYAFGSYGKIYRLFDGIPFSYDGVPHQWTQIGGPAEWIFAAENVLYAIDPLGFLWQYNGTPHSWTQIGFPSKDYAVGDDDHLYSVSTDGNAVYRYLGTPWQWEKIGDITVDYIYAVGDVLLAVTPGVPELWQYQAP